MHHSGLLKLGMVQSVCTEQVERRVRLDKRVPKRGDAIYGPQEEAKCVEQGDLPAKVGCSDGQAAGCQAYAQNPSPKRRKLPCTKHKRQIVSAS